MTAVRCPTMATDPTIPISFSSNGAESLPLHRLRDVREQQGVSVRSAARRLGVDTRTVRTLEEPTADLRLSDLHRWQQMLDVPIADLLVEPEGNLSPAILERARLVKLMKTAQAMLEKSPNQAMKRLAQMMIEQLCELMPELAGVGAWPAVGKRRSHEDVGKIAEQQIRWEVSRNDSE